MNKQVIGGPLGQGIPLSPGIRIDDFVFVSGQTGDIDDAGASVEGIEAQTNLCFERVKGVLQGGGVELEDVIKVTVFLGDAGNFTEMNKVYANYFPNDPPARSTIAAGLVRPGMLIEIECIACAQS